MAVEGALKPVGHEVGEPSRAAEEGWREGGVMEKRTKVQGFLVLSFKQQKFSPSPSTCDSCNLQRTPSRRAPATIELIR